MSYFDKPQRNPGRTDYFTIDYMFGKNDRDYDLNNKNEPELREGFSFDKAHQDQEAAGYITFNQVWGAGGDGEESKKGRRAYYEKIDPSTPSAAAHPPAPAPPPQSDKAPEPKPQRLPDRVIDGKQRANDFDSLVSHYGINRSSSPSLESSLNGIKGDAVAMAENAWSSAPGRQSHDGESHKKAKAKAQAFNGPGQTSTTVDYNNITGENVAERVRRENQSMTHTFKNNWKDYLNPQLPHLLSPEGM